MVSELAVDDLVHEINAALKLSDINGHIGNTTSDSIIIINHTTGHALEYNIYSKQIQDQGYCEAS